MYILYIKNFLKFGVAETVVEWKTSQTTRWVKKTKYFLPFDKNDTRLFHFSHKFWQRKKHNIHRHINHSLEKQTWETWIGVTTNMILKICYCLQKIFNPNTLLFQHSYYNPTYLFYQVLPVRFIGGRMSSPRYIRQRLLLLPLLR